MPSYPLSPDNRYAPGRLGVPYNLRLLLPIFYPPKKGR